MFHNIGRIDDDRWNAGGYGCGKMGEGRRIRFGIWIREEVFTLCIDRLKSNRAKFHKRHFIESKAAYNANYKGVCRHLAVYTVVGC
jgi:hypothetical protein